MTQTLQTRFTDNLVHTPRLRAAATNSGGSGNREINHSLWNQGKSYNIVLSPHC